MTKSRNITNTQYNNLGKPNRKNTWGGFNLAILEVKQIHYERIEVLQ